MVWPVVGAALLTGARFLGTKAVGLFSTKLTVGGAVTVAAAPTILAGVDQATGHVFSETLIENTPFGPALEALLDAHEMTTGMKASVVSNLVQGQLEEAGKYDRDNPDPTAQRLSEAVGQGVIGDTVGAASIAADLGLQPSDIVDAVNAARADNPDATMGQVGTIAFDDLLERVKAQELTADAGVVATTAAPALASSGSDVAAPEAGAAFADASADKGVWSVVVDFFASVLGIPGAIADRVKSFISDFSSGDLVSQGNLNLLGVGADLLPRGLANAPRPELAAD